MSIKYCRTCRLSDKDKQVCLLFGIPVNLDIDYCSKHADEIISCNICGAHMITPGFVQEDAEGNWLKYCDRCNQLFNTCQLCSHARTCEFETNPDPMPKVIVKTVQQGNMVMQAQVKNPDRIAKFCHNCICWLSDGIDACGKEFNIGCYKQDNIKISSRES